MKEKFHYRVDGLPEIDWIYTTASLTAGSIVLIPSPENGNLSPAKVNSVCRMVDYNLAELEWVPCIYGEIDN